MIGAWLGKHIVLRMSTAQFNRMLDLMMLTAGISLLIASVSSH